MNGASSGVRAWRAAFYVVARTTAGGGPKTSPRDVTTWVGLVRGERFRLRISPRLRVAGEHFLTSSNHRLRSSHAGRGGHFLDVEVLSGPLLGDAVGELVAMIEAVERETGEVRPVRVRPRGARLRSGSLGADIMEDGDDRS